MHVSRRLRTIGVLVAAITAAALGLTAAPASAAMTLNNGTGAFTAAAVATYAPPPVPPNSTTSSAPCSIYTSYHANLRFSTGEVIDIRSQPGQTWGEGPEGTYNEAIVPDCAATNTSAIPNFSATFRNSSGNVCSLAGGSYKRGLAGTDPWNELNVQFVFNTIVSGSSVGCPASTVPLTINTTIARVDFGPTVLGAIATGSTTANGLPGPLGVIGGSIYDAFVGGQVYAAACAGPIAPPSCLLRPAGQGALATTP